MSDRADSSSRTSSASERKKIGKFRRFYNGPFWNIFLLALAWAATLTSSTLLTTIGPLSAKSIGGSDGVATFTIGGFLIGAAASSVPSGSMFRHMGRKYGFLMGCLMQIIGGILGMISVDSTDTILLVISCGFVGLGQGIGQFYRFSATEMTPDKYKARAVTYVLTGGVLAAFLGPISATYSRTVFDTEYVGGFFAIGLIAVANALIVCAVRFPILKGEKRAAKLETSPLVRDQDTDRDLPAGNGGAERSPVLSFNQPRKLWDIITQPLFIISCLIPTSAHTMMVMLMSSVTLAMTKSGYSFNQSSMVMVSHFLAMFGPGFFTGNIIGKYGALAVSVIGGALFACSTAVMWEGELLWNYFAGMILCGVGWNFSFSAGTVMLMGAYKPEEATDVQAFNDFVLFGIAGGGSLASGILFSVYGWKDLIYAVAVVVLLNTILFLVSWKIKKQLEQERTASNLYQAINPAALGKAYESENASSVVESNGDYDSSEDEDEDGIVQGVEWWQPANTQTKSSSFAVFGRPGASGDRDQQEMMMRSASVI